MLKKRVMPCLLLRDGALVKTTRFRDSNYIGDPINAVRIYNEKEVDEIIFLDITATAEGREPSFEVIEEIASECFMPFAYGGGVRTMEAARRLFSLGIEKICLNSYANETPTFVTRVAEHYGRQAVVASIDVRKQRFGNKYRVYTHAGQKNTGIDPVEYARKMEKLGAGEILLTSIDRDGTMQGYDIDLIKAVSSAVRIPVIASGGAGKIEHFGEAVNKGGASAVAAGSMFVYFGRNRAVLINFPTRKQIEEALT